jgi:hypothetical protein
MTMHRQCQFSGGIESREKLQALQAFDLQLINGSAKSTESEEEDFLQERPAYRTATFLKAAHS